MATAHIFALRLASCFNVSFSAQQSGAGYQRDLDAHETRLHDRPDGKNRGGVGLCWFQVARGWVFGHSHDQSWQTHAHNEASLSLYTKHPLAWLKSKTTRDLSVRCAL